MNEKDWKTGLRMKLEELVDTYVSAGVKQEDIFDAIVEDVASLRLALERDPDPADDMPLATLQEPANDWPGADGPKPTPGQNDDD
jgi:hypothetical protein